MLLVQSLLVHAVPGFMHGTEHSGCYQVFNDPGGDAHVANAEAGGEGMRRAVLPSSFPVISEAGDDIYAKIPLLLVFVLQGQETVINLRAGADGANQFNLLRAQPVENILDVGSFEPGFEIIQ